MKSITQMIRLFLPLVFISSALASDYTGKVENIIIRDSDGLVYIDLTGSRSNDVPECAKNRNYMKIKNENSASGKRQLAMLMLAQASNRTVAIKRANTCTRWHDGEDIVMVILQRK